MLNFDDMTPEQKEALRKMSPEIAALMDQEIAAAQEELDAVFTLEKYRGKLQENIKKIQKGEWDFI